MNPFARKKTHLSAMKHYGKRLVKREPHPKRVSMPDGVPTGPIIACPTCSKLLGLESYERALRVCPQCGAYGMVGAYERLAQVLDDDIYLELSAELVGGDPLGFPGYPAKLVDAQDKTGLAEAVVTVVGCIGGTRCVVGVLDGNFLMGSMGAAVGEKVARAARYATYERLPLVMFCASGGARMQEGIFSLMQMSKTAAAIRMHDEAGLLYVSVLTHPTTGGVTASFASLGDIILAEPGALIGFTGPRVIEQTIHQKLPQGFQRAESLYECGFLDAIVKRRDLKTQLGVLLRLHATGGAVL